MSDFLFVVWLLDILNLIPILDDVIPINTVAWIIIWLFM